MVNLCAARKICGCDPKLNVFKITNQRQHWIEKIPVNKGFTDVKIGDALCSSHFDSESFKNVTSDTNQTRKRNKQSGEAGDEPLE